MSLVFTLLSLLLSIVGGYFVFKAAKLYSYRKDYTHKVQSLAPEARQILDDLDVFFAPTHKVSNNDIEAFLKKNKDVISEINNLYRKDKPFYSILHKNGLIEFRDKIKKTSLEVRKNENNQIYYSIQRLRDLSNKADKTYEKLLAPSHYFSHSELELFIPMLNAIKKLVNSLKGKYATFINGIDEKFAILSENINQKRKDHNDEFEIRELKRNRLFFDTILGKYPLDAQQRKSIVKLEDNCLVISSAGSGKTSTSIAKVKYLLDKRHLKEEEILVMSFNNKTAKEFRDRLNIPNVTCETFHAEALHIVTDVEGNRPSISDPKDHLLTQCHYLLVRENTEYKKAVTDFVTDISSMMKREHEYKESKAYYEDRAKYGIVSPYLDMDGKPIYTKSEEERRICIWLSEHDVHFRYEESYPIPTLTSQYRQYKPDFTIHYRNGNNDCVAYLEHFGIDANGNVPLWFGDGIGDYALANSMYNAGINWKRNLHKANNTKLLETKSAQFSDGTVFDELERQLRAISVPVKLLSEDERFELIFNRDKYMEENIINLLSSIINLMKSNGKSYQDVLDIIRDNENDDFLNRSKFLLYKIVKPLRDKYEQMLRERNEKDFTDIILLATDYCNTGRWQSPFKYIIVDEFQDISTSRYKFIQSLRRKNPLTKTFLVGDDWQSIYRFAGSDLNLFQHVENYFGYTERCKIETTYRFGNLLLNNSTWFVLKNPYQSRKNVKAPKNKFTDLDFIPFDRNVEDDYLKTLVSIIKEIPAEENILLVARYMKDIEVVPRMYRKYSANMKYPEVQLAGRKMKFLTVHAAKGLEEDHVILLNCSQDGGGFPSRVADDPILGYLLSTPDNYDYSEERRLFYVAITRAKKHAYVLYNKNMPSFFVTEMTLSGGDEEMVCPRCKKGLLKAMREDTASNDRQYRNYMCSNSVAGCNFFWRVFYNEQSEILLQYHQQMDRYFN